MALGNWRNPSIRDLQQFVSKPDPAEMQAFQQWRQSIANQGPSRYAGETAIPNRPANIPRMVRQNLGVDPRGVEMPVRGVEPGSMRYNALRQGLRFKPPVQPGAFRSGTMPMATPPGIQAGLHPQTEAWNTAMNARNASALNEVFPSTAGVRIPGGGPSVPMAGQNVAPPIGNYAPTAGAAGFPAPPSAMGNSAIARQAAGNPFRALAGGADLPGAELGPNVGGFKGGLANFALGSIMSAMPQALEARGVDFNKNVGPGRGITPGHAARSFFDYGGPATMFAGPTAGATVGLGAANAAAANDRATQQRAMLGEATGGNQTADTWLKAFQGGNALVNPLAAAGSVMKEPVDKVKEIAGKIPVLGGFLGGGGSGEDQAAAAAPEQPQAPAAPAKVYNRDTLTEVFNNVGVNPQYQDQILKDYTTQLELAKAMNGPVMIDDVYDIETTDEATAKKYDKLGKEGIPSSQYQMVMDAGEAGLTPSDADLEAGVWQSTLEMLPQILQQQQADNDYLAQQASLQAVIAPFIGQYFGQGQQTGALASQYLGQAAQNLPANMQGSAANLTSTIANGYGSNGDALAASLAMMPGLLAMERMDPNQAGNVFGNVGGQQEDPYQAIYQNQYNQALAAYQLKEQFPELFPDTTAATEEDIPFG